MNKKPVTPYQHLLTEIIKFCDSLQFRHEKLMWRYTKAELQDSWNIEPLHERVRAADQLGYEVVLLADDDGLTVKYRKKVEIPWRFRR